MYSYNNLATQLLIFIIFFIFLIFLINIFTYEKNTVEDTIKEVQKPTGWFQYS
jgi:hypothetical protein